MSTYSKKTSNAVIKQLRLTARTLETVDLDSYLVELNIHEDIFGNAVHGTMVCTDSRNLTRELPLEGEEFLYIHIATKELPDDDNDFLIRKEFRVYNVTDRKIEAGKGTQMFVLHFCSKELYRDALTPMFTPFEGEAISDVVTEIFDEYIKIPRWPDGDDNELEILDDTANPVKFISPGWTPFKCINWMASKAISSEGRACNYLFWETTKRFYFGSVEKIFADLAESGIVAGYYNYQERDISLQDIQIEPNPNREFFSVNDIHMKNVNDNLRLATEGDIATTALAIDINKKEITNTVYMHPEEWEKYTHLLNSEVSQAIWSTEFTANPKNAIYFTPKNTHLFDEFDNNVNENYKDVFGKRIANFRDINNFKIDVTIQGRTDIQCGTCIHLTWPDTLIKANDGWSYPGNDRHYTGYYLITAIRHKITPFNYICILEVVKDAFDIQLTDGTPADYVFEGEPAAAADAITQQQTDAGI